MSHFRRSNFGRFQSNTATESYQRQLTAPVNKWKRQWVSPTGLAPESSYKICKWVKIKEKAKLHGAAYEVRDDTPAPEDEEEEDGDGDGDEGMDEDQDEGEGEGEGDEDEGGPEGEDEGKVTEDPTPAPDGVNGATEATLEVKPDTTTPSVPQPETTGTIEPEASTETPSIEQATEPESTNQGTTPSADAHGVSPQPIAPAVQVSNVPPGSTEDGSGLASASVRLESRPAEGDAGVHSPVAEGEGEGEGEKMDVDVDAEGTTQAEAEAEAPVEKDEGLVMGEMEPPAEQAELEVDGVDPPAEVE